MDDKKLREIQKKVTDLALRYEHVRQSHTRLQSDHLQLLQERDRLLEHNRLARDKIETMIARLKTMEEEYDG